MRTALKWAGRIVGSLVLLVVVAAGAMYYVGNSRINTTHAVQLTTLDVGQDSAVIARGAHLADINGCTDCHGENLAGKIFVDAPPFRITAANLTAGKGGVGATYTAEDYDRAIRHGVKKNGRSVVIMPSAAFHNMSDDEAAALIAYVQSVPPVDNEMPPTEIRPLGRVLAAAVLDPAFEVRQEAPPIRTAPPAGPTEAYGEYLANITCAYCHGENLRGLQAPPIPESPPAPDLAAAGLWPLDQFKHALRTGERPGGDTLDVEFMPYTFTAHMSDVELEAIHKHLSTLASQSI